MGLLLSAVFLYATLRTVPLAKVVDALASARPQWIAAALASLIVGYALKVHRWATMLRALGSGVSTREAATPFLGGIAFNNVLPFRSGDIIRVVAFQRFTGIPASGQIGTLVLERLLDMLVLMAILFTTISYADAGVLDETLLAGLRLAALGMVIAIAIFIAAPGFIRLTVRALERRLPQLRHAGEALLRLSEAVATLSRPVFILRLAALSVLAWLAEGGAYYAVGRALDVAPSLQAALLALSVGTLSTLIPSSPGYVGTFHYFTARTLSSFGATTVGAAAYAILIHAILWLSTTATGFLLLAISGLRRRPTPAPDTESALS